MGDYAWLTESPTEATVILMSDTLIVLRVDKLPSSKLDFSFRPETAVILYSQDPEFATIDGARVDLAVGPVLDILEYVLAEDPGSSPPEGKKVLLSGWKDDAEVLPP